MKTARKQMDMIIDVFEMQFKKQDEVNEVEQKKATIRLLKLFSQIKKLEQN